jgi:hypothetical protein
MEPCLGPGSDLAASERLDRYCSAILFGSMEDDSKEDLGLACGRQHVTFGGLFLVGWQGDIAVFTVRVALHDYGRGNAVFTVRVLARLGWLGLGVCLE